MTAEAASQDLLLRPSVTLPLEVCTPESVRQFDAAEAELTLLLAKPSF